MSSTHAPQQLRDFAFKKQAPSDGVVNIALNFIVTYFMIGGVALVPIVAPAGSSFSKSVLGSLVVPAVLIAFVISLLTTNITLRKRASGEVVPKLQHGGSWLGWAFGWGLMRAVINLLVVYGIAGVIIQFYPGAEVSRITASVIVAVIAGVLAYIESANAVLRTRERWG